MSALRETMRRGWCPSTLKPMETGDGWLVRLHPPGARFSPEGLLAIAALARRHGNGLVEISARGNMQLRGITAASHPDLVAALLAGRLVDEHDGAGPQRLTLTSPLAGSDENDLIDAPALAAAIEAGARGIAGLPPKFLVVIDGGGLSLNEFPADLRLLATGPDRIALCLPHGDWRGPLSLTEASAAALAVIARFAGLLAGEPDASPRLRDIAPERLAGLCDLPRIAQPPDRPEPRRAGTARLHDGRFAAMACLPFGRCDAEVLAEIGRAALASNTQWLRLSPWRGICCLGLSEVAAERWLAAADGIGLIVDEQDPRLSVQACAGHPACLRAETTAMADAALLARAAAPLLTGHLSLHVSGCAKACAHPGRADLTLVGRDGRYDVVVDGSARDKPIATLDLPAILERLRPGQDLFARLSQPGRSAGR